MRIWLKMQTTTLFLSRNYKTMCHFKGLHTIVYFSTFSRTICPSVCHFQYTLPRVQNRSTLSII